MAVGGNTSVYQLPRGVVDVEFYCVLHLDVAVSATACSVQDFLALAVSAMERSSARWPFDFVTASECSRTVFQLLCFALKP